MVMRRSAPGAQTETVLARLAVEPLPSATELGADADAPAPMATAPVPLALAPAPNAVCPALGDGLDDSLGQAKIAPPLGIQCYLKRAAHRL